MNNNKTVYTEIITFIACNFTNGFKKNISIFKPDGTITPWDGDDLLLYRGD